MRARLLDRLDAAWRDLLDSYAGLADADLLAPGVTGAWSVRDIVAHVSVWEEEALKHLPLVLEGERPPRYLTTYGGIDAFNALMIERLRGLPLPGVLRRRDDVHRRLVAYLETVPAEQCVRETRFRRRLRLDTFGHYPKHAAGIRAWRERGV
ncbi:MAG: DinB family protein [bacterium]|nr:DinB family protein [bacterium]